MRKMPQYNKRPRHKDAADKNKRTAGRGERKRLIGVLDVLARRLCFKRDHGLCRRCGGEGHQLHHLLSRRHASVRHVSTNWLLLCADCHSSAHLHRDSFNSWAINEIGQENWAQLEAAKNWSELTLQELSDLAHLYRGSV
jgi:5-methylcytosine-specific restriction endonuclease McrA